MWHYIYSFVVVSYQSQTPWSTIFVTKLALCVLCSIPFHVLNFFHIVICLCLFRRFEFVRLETSVVYARVTRGQHTIIKQNTTPFHFSPHLLWKKHLVCSSLVLLLFSTNSKSSFLVLLIIYVFILTIFSCVCSLNGLPKSLIKVC